MSGSKSFNPKTRFQRNKDLVFREIDREVVMLSVNAGRYYGLDEIGSEIWAIIEEPHTVEEICDRLIEEFEVEIDQCLTDVLRFLDIIVSRDLVKIVDE